MKVNPELMFFNQQSRLFIPDFLSRGHNVAPVITHIPLLTMFNFSQWRGKDNYLYSNVFPSSGLHFD